MRAEAQMLLSSISELPALPMLPSCFYSHSDATSILQMTWAKSPPWLLQLPAYSKPGIDHQRQLQQHQLAVISWDKANGSQARAASAAPSDFKADTDCSKDSSAADAGERRSQHGLAGLLKDIVCISSGGICALAGG